VLVEHLYNCNSSYGHSVQSDLGGLGANFQETQQVVIRNDNSLDPVQKYVQNVQDDESHNTEFMSCSGDANHTRDAWR
jgi:hypothetical protein